MSNFYEYSQNNSGGTFMVDDSVCHRMFIEADSIKEANSVAEDLGVYFNGCDEGMDCSCCGDRWYEPYDTVKLEEINEKGYEVSVYSSSSLEKDAEDGWVNKYGSYELIKLPEWETKYSLKSYIGKIKFRDIEEYAQFMADEYGWTIPDTRIFYKNGTKKEIYKKKTV